jgi:predicted ATP-grasp superfamily ATP-dependent carboligase
MRILAWEHFSALGGAAPPALAREGGAMLGALAADLSRAGHDVVTVLGPAAAGARRRRAAGAPGLDRAAGPDRSFRDAAGRVDAVWIVAPETGRRLERLTRAALEAGAKVLGSSPPGIRVAASKWRTAAALRRAGVPVVPTRRLRGRPGGNVVGDWAFPLVAKPDDGVGCDRVELVRRPGELGRALRRGSGRPRAWVVQPRVRGVAASVAVLAGPGCAVPLALCSQRVRAGVPFAYAGGEVPLESPAAGRARAAAVRACRAIPGLAGYVGVDLILTPGGPLVVELNPRLTTSYLGLRAATRANLAAAAIAAVEGRRPAAMRFERTVRFDAGGRVRGR